MAYLWIAIGSALGGMARHWVAVAVAALLGEAFPWGTILVKVSGSLVIGFLAAIAGGDGRLLLGPDARHLLMAGLCGGYTTFSAFSLQTLARLRDGDWLGAAGNVALSVVLCLAAVVIGFAGAAAVNQMRGPERGAAGAAGVGRRAGRSGDYRGP